MSDARVLSRLRELRIETPSWGYGNSGTRFHVFPWPGAARTVWQRIDDAALVQSLTGCCPTVAIHVPWDRVDDWGELRRHAEDQGIAHRRRQPERLRRRRVPARQPLPPRRRRSAGRRSTAAASASRSRSRSARRSSACGSPTARTTPARTTCAAATGASLASLEELYAALPEGMRLLVEYKFFEPAFYSTDLPDWGTAALVCRRLGPQAQVLVDTGHHALGHERRADRRPAAGRGAARRLPLQQPQVRGRRPDRRRRPTPSSCSASCARSRRPRTIPATAPTVRARRVHDRPVAQRRGQDRRDAAVGHEHPDGLREGAAGRRRAAGRGAGGGRRARRPPRAAGRVRDRRAAAAGEAPRRAWAWRPTRSRRSAPRATPSAWPASAARPASRARTRASSRR